MSDEVIERLARIETKVDAFKATTDDHELRLRDFEKWQSGMASWRAGLASWQAVLTALLGLIFYKMR